MPQPRGVRRRVHPPAGGLHWRILYKPPSSLLACVDADYLLVLQGVRLFRKRNRQHAILERRADLFAINAFRNPKQSLESTRLTLGNMIILRLLFLLLLAGPLTASMPPDSVTSIFFSSMPGRSAVTSNMLSFSAISTKGVQVEEEGDLRKRSVFDLLHPRGAPHTALSEILKNPIEFITKAIKEFSWLGGQLRWP